VEQRLHQLSESMRIVTDPQERLAMEQQAGALKNDIARQQLRAAELRSDEAAAATALSTEQQRWSAFNERLEALEPHPEHPASVSGPVRPLSPRRSGRRAACR
jgi:hypothetical protein